MALKFPIAAGNWSNPAIWNGGTLPDVTDEVVGGGYTVNIDQNVTVYSLGNTPYRMFSDNLIEDHSGTYTSATGTVIYSSTNGGSLGYHAFSKYNFRSYGFWQSSVANTGWLGYYFTTAKIIKRYAWTAYGGNGIYSPRTWTFEGSNDGTTWDILDTVSNFTHTVNTIYFSSVLSNTTAYTRYRINVSVTLGGSTPIISRFDMTQLSDSNYAAYTGTFNLLSGVSVNLTYLVAGLMNETIKFQATSGTSSINVINPVYGVYYRAIYCDAPTPAVLDFYGAISAGSYQAIAPTTVLKVNTGTLNLIYNNTSTGRAIDTTGHTIASSSIINFAGGIMNVIGEIYNQGGNNCIVINTSNTCILNVTGNVNNTNQGSTISAQIATTINVTGNLYNATSGIAINCSAGPSNINITGNIIQQGTNNYCLNCSSSITVNIDHTGICYGGSYPAIYNLNGICKLSGPFIGSQTTGVFPIQVAGLRLKSQPTYFKIYDSTLTQSRSIYTSTFAPDYPMPADVRFGISYNSGAMTGTMKIPSANSVALGVSVDNTQGTAFLTPGVVPAAVWDYLTTNITTSGSIGERLKNSLTADSLGEQIEALSP